VKNLLTVILAALAVLFLGLYLHERGKPARVIEKAVTVERRIEVPKEIIKEVPVEKIVEKEVRVPVEVVKEVPAKIPDNYVRALVISNKIANAQSVSKQEEVLQGVKSVSLDIYLGGKARQLVDEGLLRTKLELSLRRSGITLDPNSPWTISYAIKGMAIKRKDGEETRTLSFTATMDLNETVLIPRSNTWKMVQSGNWSNHHYGVVSYDDASSVLISNAVDTIDGFSNEWLTQNPK
jgi:hypothetical protein